MLLEHNIGAALVLNKTETLVGMLSMVDLVTALGDMIDINRATSKA